MNARTYLLRPFPDAWQAIMYIIATTIISVVVAFIVATFQLVRSSGH